MKPRCSLREGLRDGEPMACEEEWLAEGQREPGVLKCPTKDGGVCV